MFRKRITKLTQRVTSLFVALFLVGLQSAIAPAAAYADNSGPQTFTNDKVRICHRSDSYTNPYQDIEVSKNAVDGVAGNSGQQPDHYGEHQGPIFYPDIPKHTEWGDIIPPVSPYHTGWNWTAAGQAIWNSECNFPNGDLKVDKRVDNNSDGIFELGTTDSGSEANTINGLGFRWGVDDEVAARNMGSTAEDIPAGNHTVTEKNVDGYAFVGWYYTTSTSKSCTNPNGTTLPVNITVEKNETRRITLCNAKEKPKTGTITIHKDAIPHTTNGEYFDFTSNVEGTETFKLDDEPGVGNNNIPESRKFTLPVGQYTFTELEKAGWKLKDIVCTTQNGVQINGSTVTINLTADQDITCNFTNLKTAKLTIVKEATPESSQTFNYTSYKLGNFSLVDDGSDENNSKQFNDLLPNEYKVTEQQIAGWDLKYIHCSGTKDWNTEDAKLEVELKAGDDVICVFKNKQRGTIQGHKFNDKNSNGVWDEGEEGLAHWNITLYSCKPQVDNYRNPFLNYVPENTIQTLENCNNEVDSDWTNKHGGYSFENLVKGNYKVCEQTKDYWTQTLPATDDGCYKITINEYGQVVTANFGNHHNVSLDIAKSNNKPNAVVAGDTVTYTINVTVPEDSDTVYDATTVDVLPSGFSYISGSWTAYSDARGNISGSPTTEPTYGDGSEGVWTLGTMVSGETVTLTYQVKIGASVSPGTYTNTAFVKGFDNPRCGDISEEVDQEFARYEYGECNKKCSEVISKLVTSDVTVAAVLGESVFTPGQVLGASTLANTGASLKPLQFILPVLMLLGTAYLTVATRKTSLQGGK